MTLDTPLFFFPDSEGHTGKRDSKTALGQRQGATRSACAADVTIDSPAGRRAPRCR